LLIEQQRVFPVELCFAGHEEILGVGCDRSSVICSRLAWD